MKLYFGKRDWAPQNKTGETGIHMTDNYKFSIGEYTFLIKTEYSGFDVYGINLLRWKSDNPDPFKVNLEMSKEEVKEHSIAARKCVQSLLYVSDDRMCTDDWRIDMCMCLDKCHYELYTEHILDNMEIKYNFAKDRKNPNLREPELAIDCQRFKVWRTDYNEDTKQYHKFVIGWDTRTTFGITPIVKFEIKDNGQVVFTPMQEAKTYDTTQWFYENGEKDPYYKR